MDELQRRGRLGRGQKADDDRQGAEGGGREARAGSQPLWSGTLRIGTPHGSANFSQSKNEYADPCPGEAGNNSRSASYNLNFYINHRYSQDSANEFDVNVQLLRPQSACPGRGTDTAGFVSRISLRWPIIPADTSATNDAHAA